MKAKIMTIRNIQLNSQQQHSQCRCALNCHMEMFVLIYIYSIYSILVQMYLDFFYVSNSKMQCFISTNQNERNRSTIEIHIDKNVCRQSLICVSVT